MIRGSTRVLAILGHPVRHSLSPEMHNAACRALGLDAVYVPVDVEGSALPHVLRGFEAAGIGGNVTVPHKVQAANLLFRKTDIAAELEAVNTFWPDGNRLIGDNTDVAGVLDALAQLDAPSPWLVAGTGGSARAVAAAARDASAVLLVRSRDARRAADFVTWARRIGADAAEDDGRQVGTAINATPLGLKAPDALPIAPERVDGCAAALDLVYAAGETRWCGALRPMGVRVADGRLMLVGQGIKAFNRFFPDTEAPREVMKAAVERALNR